MCEHIDIFTARDKQASLYVLTWVETVCVGLCTNTLNSLTKCVGKYPYFPSISPPQRSERDPADFESTRMELPALKFRKFLSSDSWFITALA